MIGAWSLDGTPAKPALGPENLRAMCAQMPGAQTELERGALWMVAAPGKLRGCAAYEGFIPESEWRAAPARTPEGHYALAWSDRAGTRLTLLRALSGGERLYYLTLDRLLLFSSSLRPLLAHPKVVRRLDRTKIREALLTGLTLSGDGTLLEGIREVPAGHALHVENGAAALRWHYPGLLEPQEGEPRALARRYREALGRAVAISAGATRPVAVTLSGGIDSAAIAALAVEAFGADSVVAYTYEFHDPQHRASETPYAVDVCRRLGIRRHEVFRIGLDRFLAAIPETVWRAESFVHWPKAFMLLATQRIRDDGFDRFLSGFGIGSHMAYFEDVASLLRWLPAPLLARYWRLAQVPQWRWLAALEHLHPGFSPPNLRVLYLLLKLLGEPARYCGSALAHMLERFPADPGVDAGFEDMPLVEQLRHQSFAHLVSCIDVTRWEKPLRELGACRVSPAHFASTIPYAYLDYLPRPPFWSAARRQRPGKHLLRIAMRDMLPESVLFRRKSWADAVISRAWLAAGTRWMRGAVPDYWRVVGGDDDARALRRWDARSPQAAVTALAFWNRLFVERPPSGRAPTWEELLA